MPFNVHCVATFLHVGALAALSGKYRLPLKSFEYNQHYFNIDELHQVTVI